MLMAPPTFHRIHHILWILCISTCHLHCSSTSDSETLIRFSLCVLFCCTYHLPVMSDFVVHLSDSTVQFIILDNAFHMAHVRSVRKWMLYPGTCAATQDNQMSWTRNCIRAPTRLTTWRDVWRQPTAQQENVWQQQAQLKTHTERNVLLQARCRC